MSSTPPSQLLPPDTDPAVRKLLDVEKRKVRDWATGVVKEVHEQRDQALLRFDEVASALGVLAAPKVASTPRTRSKNPRRRSTAVLASERRHAIFRFLSERARPMAFSEIQRELRLTEFSTRSALKRLVEEGKVIRTGTGSSTRYQAKPDGSAAPLGGHARSPEPSDHGSDQGRLLATVVERGFASVEELAQATHLSPEQVERECGALIREGEMRMARPQGRAVYVPGRAA
jgi:DNA-binding transcriptional ArsR family regulator